MDQELESQLNAQLNGQEVDTEDQQEDEQVVDQQDEQVEEEQHQEKDTHEDDDSQGRPSRAQARIQKLAAEREELRVARERAETEARLLREQLQRMQQPPKEEEVLDPDEKWRREANNAIRQTQAMAFDMSDKAEFLTKYSSNPEAMALRDEIESKLKELRAQGSNAPRENLLKFLMGERALQRQAKAPAVRKQAAERVSQAKGAPLGAKSNVAPSKSEPSLHDRLKDVLL